MKKNRFRIRQVAVGLAAVAVFAALGFAGARSFGGRDIRPESVPRPDGPPHPTYIRESGSLPEIATEFESPHGTAVTVACSTCHDVKTPNPNITSGTQLVDFHKGMDFHHGGISCVACHNADNYDTLRLADGQALAFANSINLCSQCHGTQARDFRHGAHGGMTGHWDLSAGPRKRGTCIDCHDPHNPAYPVQLPVFPPLPTSPPTSH